MTLTEAIDRCLVAIRDQFYDEDRPRDFLRDRTALIKAVARYGVECERRGWRFDEIHIVQAILKLLPQIKPPDHQWLPVYLEKCIDRHVGQRSEELQAESRRIDTAAEKVLREARLLNPSPKSEIRNPKSEIRMAATEVLAALHREHAAKIRAGKARKKAAAGRAKAPAEPSGNPVATPMQEALFAL
jgi:hypothetical protein